MTSDIRSQIEATNKKFVTACKQGNAGAMASLYTGEGQLLPANSDFVRGPDAIRGFWQGVMGTGIKDVSLETVELDPQGDTAIEVGRYPLLADAGAVADQGKYIVVWKNQGAPGRSTATSGRRASPRRVRKENKRNLGLVPPY